MIIKVGDMLMVFNVIIECESCIEIEANLFKRETLSYD